MRVVECAFCKGKGKDPFELLSKLATCQVCGGTGKVEVIEPAIKCAFCKGTGVYPRNGCVTCTVCNGKGMVTVKGETEGCRTEVTTETRSSVVTMNSVIPRLQRGGFKEMTKLNSSREYFIKNPC